MPNTWFQNGITKVTENIDYLFDTVTLYAALVGGTGVTVDPDWITLDQFLVSNSLLSDSAGNKDVVTGGTASTQGWNPTDEQFNFGINGTIDFGVVNVATQIGGVVFYTETTSVTPTTAILIGVQDSPEIGAGGIVTWGGPSNTIGFWKPKVSQGGTVAFQGTIDRLVNLASSWEDSAFDVGFALVRDINTKVPLGNETTIASITPATTWCTNADPASAVANGAFVPMSGLQRFEQWAVGTDSFDLIRQAETSGGKEIKWPQTGSPPQGAIVVGEIAVGVVAFIYPAGAYSDATAFLLNWDFIASKTIAAGQDLIYGATATNVVRNTFVRALVI